MGPISSVSEKSIPRPYRPEEPFLIISNFFRRLKPFNSNSRRRAKLLVECSSLYNNFTGYRYFVKRQAAPRLCRSSHLSTSLVTPTYSFLSLHSIIYVYHDALLTMSHTQIPHFVRDKFAQQFMFTAFHKLRAHLRRGRIFLT